MRHTPPIRSTGRLLLFLYRQKGWKTMIRTRLQTIKHNYKKECGTNPLDPRTYRQIIGCTILHQARCMMGIQQH
jgi:hypothetical protein